MELQAKKFYRRHDMLKRIFNFVTYLPEFEDDDSLSAAQYTLFAYLTGLSFAFGLVIYYIMQRQRPYALLIGIILLVGLYGVIELRRGRLPESIALPTVLVIFLTILLVTFGNGLHGLGLFVLFPFFVVLAYFTHRRNIIILGVGLFIWIWALYLLEINEFYLYRDSDIPLFWRAFFISAIFIFSLALLQISYQRINRINKNLRISKIGAEEANLAKSNFLATISHELRTPLNAIIGYSEFILEELEEVDFSDEHQRDLVKIKKSGESLLGMINNILDLSKIEAGRLTLSMSTFSVAGLIKEVVEVVMPMAQKNVNQIDISNRLSFDEDMITTDRQLVRQILLNLLSNAAKFCENGLISVDIECAQHPHTGKDAFLFTVQDTGIGIRLEKLEEIFKPFAQSDNSLSRKFSGTGLGLAISYKYACQLGGVLSVESEEGIGSIFRLYVPFLFEGALEDEVNLKAP